MFPVDHDLRGDNLKVLILQFIGLDQVDMLYWAGSGCFWAG